MDELDDDLEESPTVICLTCGEEVIRANYGARAWVHYTEELNLSTGMSTHDHQPQVPDAVKNIITIRLPKGLPG